MLSVTSPFWILIALKPASVPVSSRSRRLLAFFCAPARRGHLILVRPHYDLLRLDQQLYVTLRETELVGDIAGCLPGAVQFEDAAARGAAEIAYRLRIGASAQFGALQVREPPLQFIDGIGQLRGFGLERRFADRNLLSVFADVSRHSGEKSQRGDQPNRAHYIREKSQPQLHLEHPPIRGPFLKHVSAEP